MIDHFIKQHRGTSIRKKNDEVNESKDIRLFRLNFMLLDLEKFHKNESVQSIARRDENKIIKNYLAYINGIFWDPRLWFPLFIHV